MTNEAQMNDFFQEALEKWQHKIDVVCANAGTGGPAGAIETLDYREWQNCVSVNLFGAFLTCSLAAKNFKHHREGLILLTASTSGLFGVPYRSPYVAAKWAIVGLTKTLAMELGDYGVRVNAIAPGAVEGERMERVLQAEAKASGKSIEEIRKIYAQGVSLRSWVKADDIADMALFLASEKASKITGQIMSIDGHTERVV